MKKQISNFNSVYFSDVMKAYLYSENDSLNIIKFIENTDFSISNTVTATKVNGHNNRKAGTIYSEKGATFSVTTSILSDGLFAFETGEAMEELDSYTGIRIQDEVITLAQAGDPIVLSHPARGEVGSEVLYIEMGGVRFTQSAVADDESFSYDPTTQTITPPTDPSVVDATTITVSYPITVNNVTKVVNSTTQKVETYDIFIDGYATVMCAEGESSARVQIIGKVQTTGNFDMNTAAASENPVTVEGEFVSGCGIDKLWEAYFFTEDNIDDVVV